MEESAGSGGLEANRAGKKQRKKNKKKKGKRNKLGSSNLKGEGNRDEVVREKLEKYTTKETNETK